MERRDGHIQYGETLDYNSRTTDIEEDDDDDNEAFVYIKEFTKMWMTEGHARKRNEGSFKWYYMILYDVENMLRIAHYKNIFKIFN